MRCIRSAVGVQRRCAISDCATGVLYPNCACGLGIKSPIGPGCGLVPLKSATGLGVSIWIARPYTHTPTVVGTLPHTPTPNDGHGVGMRGHYRSSSSAVIAPCAHKAAASPVHVFTARSPRALRKAPRARRVVAVQRAGGHWSARPSRITPRAGVYTHAGRQAHLRTVEADPSDQQGGEGLMPSGRAAYSSSRFTFSFIALYVSHDIRTACGSLFF